MEEGECADPQHIRVSTERPVDDDVQLRSTRTKYLQQLLHSTFSQRFWATIQPHQARMQRRWHSIQWQGQIPGLLHFSVSITSVVEQVISDRKCSKPPITDSWITRLEKSCLCCFMSENKLQQSIVWLWKLQHFFFEMISLTDLTGLWRRLCCRRLESNTYVLYTLGSYGIWRHASGYSKIVSLRVLIPVVRCLHIFRKLTSSDPSTQICLYKCEFLIQAVNYQASPTPQSSALPFKDVILLVNFSEKGSSCRSRPGRGHGRLNVGWNSILIYIYFLQTNAIELAHEFRRTSSTARNRLDHENIEPFLDNFPRLYDGSIVNDKNSSFSLSSSLRVLRKNQNTPRHDMCQTACYFVVISEKFIFRSFVRPENPRRINHAPPFQCFCIKFQNKTRCRVQYGHRPRHVIDSDSCRVQIFEGMNMTKGGGIFYQLHNGTQFFRIWKKY